MSLAELNTLLGDRKMKLRLVKRELIDVIRGSLHCNFQGVIITPLVGLI